MAKREDDFTQANPDNVRRPMENDDLVLDGADDVRGIAADEDEDDDFDEDDEEDLDESEDSEEEGV